MDVHMFSKFTSSYARFSTIQAYIWSHTLKKKKKKIKQAPSSIDMLANHSRNFWQLLWMHYKPTGVFSGVSNERAGHSEGHAAGVADVRFLSRVSSLVVH